MQIRSRGVGVPGLSHPWRKTGCQSASRNENGSDKNRPGTRIGGASPAAKASLGNQVCYPVGTKDDKRKAQRQKGKGGGRTGFEGKESKSRRNWRKRSRKEERKKSSGLVTGGGGEKGH